MLTKADDEFVLLFDQRYSLPLPHTDIHIDSQPLARLVAMSNIHKHLIDIISTKVIPPLSSKLHKGQAGRIGVLGGSGE